MKNNPTAQSGHVGSSDLLGVCPQCEGFGRIFFAFPHTRKAAEGIPCTVCGGAGQASGEFNLWREQGAILKARRIASGITLREAARRRGMDASNLSKQERGLIKPHAFEYSPNAGHEPRAGDALPPKQKNIL